MVDTKISEKGTAAVAAEALATNNVLQFAPAAAETQEADVTAAAAPAPPTGAASAAPAPPTAGASAVAGGPATPLVKWSRAKAFIIRNYLLIGVVISVIVAFAWPVGGAAVDKPKIGPFKIVQTINVVVIFIISGLTLKTSDMKAAASKEGRKGFLFGCVDILLLTSLTGFIFVNIPFSPVEFSYGLAIFCVVPTTLSAGVTLVALADGNDALALLLTVVTNMLGVVTVPFLLKAILSGASVSINAVDLLIKMSATVLIPILLGKVIRAAVPATVPWTRRYKVPLSLTSSTMLLMVMWQNLSVAANKIMETKASTLLAVVAAGIVLHVIFLAMNYPLAKMLKLPHRELKAVVIMGSEKSTPIALTVLAYLTSLGNTGLMAVPVIIAQVSQLVMDSFLVSRWGAQAAKEKRDEAVAAVAAEAATELGLTEQQDDCNVENCRGAAEASELGNGLPLAEKRKAAAA